MKKKLKYIKPEIVFIVFEICDVLNSTLSGGGTGTGSGGDDGDHAKQEDFIFDTSEDFDSPYHLFDE